AFDPLKLREEVFNDLRAGKAKLVCKVGLSPPAKVLAVVYPDTKIPWELFGRIFSAADTLFSEDMLRPELQSMDDFIDGLDNIIGTQRSVALNYFLDGSIEVACPPLKVLLHIMAYGNYQGKTITDPEIRRLFTREALVESSWYQARLDAKVKVDQALWRRHVDYLEGFLMKPNYQGQLKRLRIQDRIHEAKATLEQVSSAAYRASLVGMVGADPELV
ncbi:MAG: hypothetical protein ORN51_07985, partial [Akkermansiaceae bacterium]|nr:hypothetical protein [Akkermansiaceae bacterium]